MTTAIQARLQRLIGPFQGVNELASFIETIAGECITASAGGGTGAFTSGTFSGTLGVTGASTFTSGTFSTTLGVTGAATFTSGTFSTTLGVTGASTFTSGTFSATLGVTGAATLGSTLTVAGSIGFYGHAAAAKPTVTGSVADGTALTSLLTALAGLGLLTDSSTA